MERTPVSKDPSLDTTDPIGLPPQDIAPRPYASRVGIDVSGLTHRGKVRHNNEDHFLVARVGRSLHTLFSNLPDGEVPTRFDESGWVMMVADGMGGAAGGEVASRMAISTLVNIILDVPDWIMHPEDERAEEMMRRAVSYYRQVDDALSERAAADPVLQGMGSTMTLGYSVGDELFVAHVGDSRVYLMRDGQLQQLTKDQTHAQALADAGMIKRDEVATHRLRHVLTNALGGNQREVEVELQRARLSDGDRLLLCTDGLTDMVDDEAIAELLSLARQPGTACTALVERALANGGRDNVTVIVADCGVATK
jgi:serine/threonine protein phosphatase PrpC